MERKVIELRLDDILPNRFQPRIKFSEDSINELAESIKEHGVIQPIVVRKIGDKYEIIAGERRYKASILANKSTIPAIVTDLNDADSAEVALIENIQRRDLTPIEEAISYKKILDMGHSTQTEMAVKLGKTQSTVANKLRLLNLDEDVQEALLNEKISERHARSLLRLSDGNKQKEMLNKIINERLTVRRTDEEIDKMLNSNGNDIEFLNIESDNVESIPELNIQSNNVTSTVESLNIPTTPIVENNIPEVNIPQFTINDNVEELRLVEPTPLTPIDSEISTSISSIDNFSQSNVVNPGFMDINKIEEEAEQIYVPKPLADVDSLLSPTVGLPISGPEPSVVPIVNLDSPEEDNEDASSVLVPGKFFNILPEDNKEEAPAFEYKPLDTTAFNSFNFDLGNSAVSTTPIVDEVVSPQVPTDFSNENFINNTDINLPVNNIPQTFEQPSVNVEPVTQTMNEPIPSYDYTIPVSNPIPVSPMPVETTEKAGLRDVINIIRQCSDSIEKLGYTLDLEEFDFEDMYQVILKINK